ncbi:MAG: hypothetical protein A2428_15980 [Bdellovibrionales bacterium RIFOXYC1_FULL_54_43]|nr:MAG: hypothetical protein A2428_15980 [Bdellovibrionales bacterium RIFOXYC1_FULL_54_43]OFZ84630.1 MAG: hypothetical protein A2603_12185 [Bdellovibrionales bacterium RIFOXYD1_FULL_55_31]
MWRAFETRVCGKWVLAGEHSVLRGGTAVAIPLTQKSLCLKFRPSEDRLDGLSVLPASAQNLIQELLNSVEDHWQGEGKSFLRPKGTLEIESTIPEGAGLGSSAALCVALTKWFSEPLSIAKESWLEFATQLEHRFHGQSSGMDVSVIASGQPITFVRGREPQLLGIKHLPRFTFHDTGLRARTSQCIMQVEQFRQERPVLAMQVDEAMGAASRNALEGLVLYDRSESPDLGQKGLELIARAMKEAQECFYSWGLVPNEARHLEEDLLQNGALAAKLTGAGGGGMIVALWPEDRAQGVE